MSVINKMLQDLDRRHARAGPSGKAVQDQVRAVRAARSGSEWFWRVLAGLLFIAAAWTAWVVYQLQPRSVATELAHRAAENARLRAVSKARPPAELTAMKAAAPVAPPVPPAAPPVPEKVAAPIETLRLALSIDTPILPPSARQVVRASQKQPPAPRAPRAQPAKEAARPSAEPSHIEKRTRDHLPAERAENEFRRAAQLLPQGRIAEAEHALLSALDADRAHQPARQTLIALYIEQGRLDDARGHLEEGLSLNPSHAPYALALARLHADRGEFARALEVLGGKDTGAQAGADVHAMRGAILLRLGHHDEAAAAYRLALGGGTQEGASWIGLAISLEALGHGIEALEAFRRGLGTSGLADGLRAYAEQRVRQLQ